MVQKFGDTNIRGKLSKYTSTFANQSWELESMLQTQPYLVNVADCQGTILDSSSTG